MALVCHLAVLNDHLALLIFPNQSKANRIAATWLLSLLSASEQSYSHNHGNYHQAEVFYLAHSLTHASCLLVDFRTLAICVALQSGRKYASLVKCVRRKRLSLMGNTHP